MWYGPPHHSQRLGAFNGHNLSTLNSRSYEERHPSWRACFSVRGRESDPTSTIFMSGWERSMFSIWIPNCWRAWINTRRIIVQSRKNSLLQASALIGTSKYFEGIDHRLSCGSIQMDLRWLVYFWTILCHVSIRVRFVEWSRCVRRNWIVLWRNVEIRSIILQRTVYCHFSIVWSETREREVRRTHSINEVLCQYEQFEVNYRRNRRSIWNISCTWTHRSLSHLGTRKCRRGNPREERRRVESVTCCRTGNTGGLICCRKWMTMMM